MGELSDRSRSTEQRIAELRRQLKAAETRVEGKACVYATGSFGRCEASSHSDLDLFIVGRRQADAEGKGRSALKHLDEICLQADLIQATRDLRIPEFSGDGKYLVHYSVNDLTETLGTPEDDVTNTLTARLLLLLESRALLGCTVYREVIDDVLAAYWRDYADHKSDFIPAFLGNDILRLWRTFCVNYEARTKRQPDLQKAKGKVKNYKLKHSRMLTCYSALLFLLSIFREKGTVHPEDAVDMTSITPIQRLDRLLNNKELAEAHSAINSLIEQYDRFLTFTNASEEELVDRFMDQSRARSYMKDAYRFGDTMYEVLCSVGSGNRFHRLLVV